jgi:hypothetical protein
MHPAYNARSGCINGPVVQYTKALAELAISSLAEDHETKARSLSTELTIT